MPDTRAIEALARLKQGNQRFVQDKLESATGLKAGWRQGLLDGQQPFAAVLGCIDSRAPVELVFDVGFGDLLVTRVAGNYVSSAVVASLEFSAVGLGVPLVVVLGHTRCGAVRLTLDKLESSSAQEPAHLQELIDQIGPAFDAYLKNADESQREVAIEKAVGLNVRSTVRKLATASTAIAELVQKRELLIVGAEYCLETGKVQFFTDED